MDNEELVGRVVAHAAAAAVHFPADDGDNDVQDKPDIARNLKGELSVAADQLADLEEAPSAAEKCVLEELLQSPIPVIESTKLVSPTVFGSNTPPPPPCTSPPTTTTTTKTTTTTMSTISLTSRET